MILSPQHAVLTLSCDDRVGIVFAVAQFLADRGCNIADSQQYGDPDSRRFFMRVHLTWDGATGLAELRQAFEQVADDYAMDWQLYDGSSRMPTLILVSQHGHCLNDLLYRHSTGSLPADIRAVVSNHEDFRGVVEAHGLAFHHVPVEKGGKPRAEAALLDIVAEQQVELVVLARYMQILSDSAVSLMPAAINIHHSFLPSFKGARPYHQAHERGVKLIGATAHYVTAELDEGPIIEQEVARVDHAATPERLVEVGRDLESIALARAVGWHLDHRVLRNGSRTVVFT